MTSVAKRKVSVTVDADLVEEIEADGDNVSARFTEALRTDMAARRRQRALARLLDRLEIAEGPSTPPRTRRRFSALCGCSAGRPRPMPWTRRLGPVLDEAGAGRRSRHRAAGSR